MADFTCQICGRAIKAKHGLIAHHGYRRPGGGWQTASCFGAKYRPYELACDALEKCIPWSEAQLAGAETSLAEFVADPPAKLIWRPRVGNPIETVRPDGFEADGFHVCIPNSYASLFQTERSRRKQEIKDRKAELEYLRQRLANWEGGDRG
jgi:hypothetical protein